MGLDWNPGPKPKPGHEAEYEQLFVKLTSSNNEQLLERFHSISTTAFETLSTPVVGRDASANAWAEEVYREQCPEGTLDDWLRRLDGFNVLDLVPACDGIPMYSNGSPGGYVEAYAFRAQFLVDCEHIIGAELLEQAYESKLPDAFLNFGRQLQQCANAYAEQNGIDLQSLDTDDVDGIEFQLDVVTAAARWCVFWAERGHILDAYY
jgi:hypothetical protein